MHKTTWLLLALAACAPTLPYVTADDRAYASRTFPESADDLAESRQLYARKCGGCHQLPLPDRVPQGEWPVLLDKMAERAHLTQGEQLQISRYVLTMSRPLPQP